MPGYFGCQDFCIDQSFRFQGGQRAHDAVHSTLDDASLEGFMSLNESRQTVGGSLHHVIVLRNNQPGQIDYLRGLQEEDWDLPRGTGEILR